MKVVTAWLCGFSIAMACGAPAVAQMKMAAEPFLPPTGPFAVGTHEYFWTDQNRSDPFTKDARVRRRLIVRVWYPAEAVPGATKASYILDANEFSDSSEYRAFQGVMTNAVTDAPLAKTAARLPVLVYQPGGGTQRFIATFEAEQLASRGYVVVSADHPGFSDTVRFPDGSLFQPDRALRPEPKGDFRDDVMKNWGWLNDEVFPSWTADASYTLDQIEQLNRTAGQRFHDRLDESRIGMFGWSFGGATSIEMSIRDPRVKAVIDQDGQLFGKARTQGTKVPFMLMHHGNKDEAPKPEQAAVMQELVAMVDGWNRSLLERSPGDWYTVTIAKTQHGHFSDFMLAVPPKAGDLDPRRAHAIILAYTVAFFDKYLHGRDSDLLRAASPEYPEVTFRKRIRGRP